MFYLQYFKVDTKPDLPTLTDQIYDWFFNLFNKGTLSPVMNEKTQTNEGIVVNDF